MQAPIPFSFLPRKVLTKLSRPCTGLGATITKSFPSLQLELERANFTDTAREYLTLCVTATFFFFVVLGLILGLVISKVANPLFGVLFAFFLSPLVFFAQLNYPKIIGYRRVRKLDADLLAALSAMMIQLQSGISLFESLVIVSRQEFGEISSEFRTVVAKINAGESQIEALEDMALRNPSPYFQKVLWQIINGMKEGASITDVMDNVFKNLTKEQIVQIEKYGAELSPLVTFYMVGAIIFPALGITFLLVMTSFISVKPLVLKILFWGLLTFIVFFQIMVAGMIKTARPSLLGE